MPSPIAHSAIGYVMYRIYGKHVPRVNLTLFAVLPRLLIITVWFSLLPDVDSIAGVILGDFGRYHNSATHSIIIGFLVSLSIAAVMRLTFRENFWIWFSLSILCYQTHILMDMFTFGRGVMVLWPLTSIRYKPPIYLFYGFHWSDGLISFRHVWTITTELLFVFILYASLQVFKRINNKFSLSLNKQGHIAED